MMRHFKRLKSAALADQGLREICQRGRLSMVSIPVRSLIVASAFVAYSAVSVPAKAQGVMDAVLGILGIDEDKPEIDYRERAPLVVPPKMVLRPPEASPIDGNKAWPQDPDVQRRKYLAAQKKLPGGMTDEERKRLNGDSAAMGEVQASRGGGTKYNLPAEQNTFDNDRNKRADWLRPDVLAAESRAAELQTPKSGLEPERRYLTDPPSGLRRPSANAEFKAPKVGPSITEEDASPLSLYKTKQPDQ
jgi:hypothetical protein